MKNSSSLSYHSPEKIFFLLTIILLLLYGGYFSFRFFGKEGEDHLKQEAPAEISTADTVKKIKELQWLLPFKPVNYQNNPFDIGFKLKKKIPVAKVEKAGRQVAEVKKPRRLPVKKVIPPPLPPRIYVIEYLGMYTNLSATRFAMILAEDQEAGHKERMVLKTHDKFMKKFQIIDFNDAEMSLEAEGLGKISIPWNCEKKIIFPRISPRLSNEKH